jgi:glutaminyl-peptide cyclotransferase
MTYPARFFFIILLVLFCSNANSETFKTQKDSSYTLLKSTKVAVSDIKVINEFPHDPGSFTEGLTYYKGYLFESTGLKGRSLLRKIEIKSGRIIQETKLADDYFGEGMTIIGNKIYQLTWHNNKGFIYNLNNFEKTGQFYYNGEGWGLATDGKNLWMSNGSAVITCHSPVNFEFIGKISVHDEHRLINNINELEFVRGEIWANIFMEDVIVRISPKTGKVLGWIDLRPLYSMLPPPERRDVMNGIAYDKENDRIFVTGKFWPKIFEIRLKNRP